MQQKPRHMPTSDQPRTRLRARPASQHVAREYAARSLGAAVLIALALELLFFNFPHWESLTFDGPQSVGVTYGPGLELQEDDTYTVTDEESAYLSFDMGGEHLDNIGLDLTIAWTGGSTWRYSVPGPAAQVRVSATDAGHAALFNLPKVSYITNYPATHYLRPHLSGGSHEVRVYLLGAGTNLRVNGVTCNVVRPLDFSALRFALVAVAAFLVALLRPRSVLYKVDLDVRSRGVLAAVVLVVLAQVAIAVFYARASGFPLVFDDYVTAENGPIVIDGNQYNHVADALLAGHASLDLPVPDALRQMPDPYVTDLRERQMLQAGQTYYLDYAFYGGKYYSYFGVLPVLLSYIPFQLLTGKRLGTAAVVAVYGALLAIATPAAFYRLYRHYFDRPTLGGYLLVELAAFFGAGSIYLASLPLIYSVPIQLGLVCVLMAIWCWLGAAGRLRQKGGLSKPYLVAGGVFGGLTLLCRPIYVLVALVALAIFWQETVDDRLFFSRKGIANTLCVILPFVAIGCVAMAYNFVRFDSPLNYGATYNLTGEDMTAREFVLARVPSALFQVLFQPLGLATAFPFLFPVNMSSDFQGTWFFEPYMGGLFSLSPIALTSLVALSDRGRWLEPRRRPLGLTCLAISPVIMVVDFTVASITQRYQADFSWAVFICAALVIWSYLQEHEGPTAVKTVLVTLLFLGIFGNCMAGFADEFHANLAVMCPAYYYFLKYKIFAFLL